MNAIDTNVFIYSVDAGEPDKQAKARDVIRQLLTSAEAVRVPWQAAAEFLAKLRKWQSAGKLSPEDVRSRFEQFLATWVLVFPSLNVFRLALDYHDRYFLSHWDSLLVAACKDAGVTRLYSEDMQPGADYDGVTVINPFA